MMAASHQPVPWPRGAAVLVRRSSDRPLPRRHCRGLRNGAAATPSSCSMWDRRAWPP